MKNEIFTVTCLLIMFACIAMALSTDNVLTGNLTAAIGIISGALISLRFSKHKPNVHDKR